MRSDENVKQRRNDQGELGNFGDTTPKNSFSGGETDHLFLSHEGQQFYDLDAVSGLAHPGDGRTMCQLDYDKDGWIDFVVASADSPTFQLYRNRVGELYHRRAKGSRMVALRFEGGNRQATPSADFSSRSGYGAMVELEIEGEPLIREFRCGDGRAAQNSTTMIVGVGDAGQVRRLTVRWPSGRIFERTNIPTGSLVTMFENAAHSKSGTNFDLAPYGPRTNMAKAGGKARGERLALSFPADEGATKLNVVTAMTTHCKSCVEKQPQVGLLRETLEREGVRFFGVSTDLDETPADLMAYATKAQPNYDILAEAPIGERRALRDRILEAFKDDLTPVTFVTDARGNILLTRPGVPTVSELRKLLKRLR